MSAVERAAQNSGNPDPHLFYLVDDDLQLGEMGRDIFRTEGFEAVFFSDPRLALKALSEAKRRPELLVTDYVMGSMNGLQFIENSRQIHSAARTILLSGTVSEAFIRKQTIKPDVFLAKPYNPEELIKTAWRLLEQGDRKPAPSK
jgi:DNA-binding NtrC family response regulator